MTNHITHNKNNKESPNFGYILDIDAYKAYLSNYYEPDEVEAKIQKMIKLYGKKPEDIE